MFLYYFRISWENSDFLNIGLGETIDINQKLSLPLGPNSFTGMIDTISFSSPESGAQVTVGMYNILTLFRTILLFVVVVLKKVNSDHCT